MVACFLAIICYWVARGFKVILQPISNGNYVDIKSIDI